MLILGACREEIIHDVTENEANKFLARLGQAGIEAGKEKQANNLWRISVAQEASLQALRVLDDARLLRGTAPRPDKPGLITSREDQRFRYERAVSRELETTLCSISGVLEARVHLTFPDSDLLLGRPDTGHGGSGSALLAAEEGCTLAEEEVRKIISGAAGIPIERISVLIRKENRAPSPGPPPPARDAAALVFKEWLWYGIAAVLAGASLFYVSRKRAGSKARAPEISSFYPDEHA